MLRELIDDKRQKDLSMTAEQLEKRVEALERELAELRSHLQRLGPETPWWERIAGTFHDDPIHEKAMKLGREYRRSLRPGKSGRKEK